MPTTYAGLERQAAALARDLSLLRLAADPPPRRSAVELAERLGIAPDPWQAQVLASTAREVALLCCRQSGKSTVAALLGLHAALYDPGALALIVSPGTRQSGLLFRRLVRFYRALGEPVPADVDNRLSLELRNGSEIHALPGSEGTIRGFAGVDLLLVDEAARVADDTYQAARPMVAVSGGRIVALSTPFGARGWFHHEWTEGGPTWHRALVTAYDCPRIDPAWLEAERARIGQWWFDQEYLCRFVDATDQVFGHELVTAARSDEVEPLFAGGVPGSPLFTGEVGNGRVREPVV